MARRELKKGTEEFELFKDFFELVKDYYDIDFQSEEANEKYWDDLVHAVNKLWKKYENTKLFHFSKVLSKAFLKEQERKQIERTK